MDKCTKCGMGMMWQCSSCGMQTKDKNHSHESDPSMEMTPMCEGCKQDMDMCACDMNEDMMDTQGSM